MEWVLRSRYRQSVQEIGDFFTLLLQKSKIVCENEQALMDALCWYRRGADFADALHLAHAKSLPFYTFDERFCRKAIQDDLAPAVYIL